MTTFREQRLIFDPQTAAVVAAWPKLTNDGDFEKFVKQNIDDGADYIKLSKAIIVIPQRVATDFSSA